MTTRQADDRFADLRLEVDHAQDFFSRRNLARCLDSLQRTRAQVVELEAQLALTVKRSRK